ncbi:MAG: murein biosynthesis integral membrane protein MurJ [Spirochaetaceae bacterium]|jgi:putative peptidoglycan lipid II flippase|nr:murein biosynthesis integral membrane protein MurJ [Spirochaetaceae bacterium]
MARSLLRSGSALSLLTLVSRILGLCREAVKAALLGTTAFSDAFSVAFLIPNLFRRLFAEGSIAVAFIPTFKTYLINNNAEKTKEFLCCFFTFISFFVSLVVGIGILCSPYIVKIFALAEFDETVLLTRIMFPFLAFISIAAFFQGILNSVHVFFPSGLAPIILNIVTIGCAWFLSPYMENPARAMAIGILIGGFLEAAIQLPFVLKKRFYFKFTNLIKAIKNPGTKDVLRLIGPTIIGMAAYQLNDLVSTALASGAGEGVVSSLQYSLRLQELILGVFAVSIGTVLLPELAEHAKTLNWKMYNSRLISAIDIISLITIPVTFFSLVCGEGIVRLLFQTKMFDENSVMLTNSAFMFHITGIFFIALNRILAPAFYAQGDSVSPTIAGIISFAVNIVLAAILVVPMKGAGIALALSLAGAANTLMLFILLRRKSKGSDDKILLNKSFFYLIKMIVFSIIAASPVYLCKNFVLNFFTKLSPNSRLVNAAVPLFVFFIMFAVLGIVLLIVSGDQNIKTLRTVFTKRKRKN